MIDYKSVDGFPEYTNVLRDRCYIVEEGKKKKVMLSMLKQVMFSKEDKSKMYFKCMYKQQYQSLEFRSELPKTRGAKKTVHPMLYAKPVGISTLKKKDLLTLCNKDYIPKNHHPFFDSLTVESALIDGECVELIET